VAAIALFSIEEVFVEEAFN